MSAPRRWKDAPDAPIGMRELLASAKPSRAMDERAHRRGAGRVAKLGAAPAAAAATATIGIWTKLAAASVVGLAAVGTAHVIETRRERASEVVVAAPAPPALSSLPSPVPAPAPEEAPAPHRAAEAPVVPKTPVVAPSPRPPAPSAAAVSLLVEPAPMVPPATRSELSNELALLEDARAVLASDPERALARLEAHRRRHPAGVLAAERDLMELDALRRAGRGAEATAHARAWLARDPEGMHAARVRAILAALEPR